jgi:hypothetical protein
MKKLMIMILALAAFATAQVGVGYDGTLGGVSGLSLQVPVAENVFGQVIGGYYGAEDASGEFDHNASAALRGWYVLGQKGSVSLLVGAGVSFQDLTTDFDANNVNVEVPLGLDYQFTENFSISGQTGVAVQLGDNVAVDAFQNSGPTAGAMFMASFAFHAWL